MTESCDIAVCLISCPGETDRAIPVVGAETGTLDTVAVGWTTFVAMLLIIWPGSTPAIPMDPAVAAVVLPAAVATPGLPVALPPEGIALTRPPAIEGRDGTRPPGLVGSCGATNGCRMPVCFRSNSISAFSCCISISCSFTRFSSFARLWCSILRSTSNTCACFSSSASMRSDFLLSSSSPSAIVSTRCFSSERI